MVPCPSFDMAEESSVESPLLSYPLDELADAAISKAKILGAQFTSVRIEFHRKSKRAFRDCIVESEINECTLGMGVQVYAFGSWGYASTNSLSTGEALALSETAIKIARLTAEIRSSNEPTIEPVSCGTWKSNYKLNPFYVPVNEQNEAMIDFSSRLIVHSEVDHVYSSITCIQEDKYLADSDGRKILQHAVYINPLFSAYKVMRHGYFSMRTLAPPTARGWEYMLGDGWDFDAEIDELPTLLNEHALAPSIKPGSYDLLIDPTNLWLTVHETIAHATELDRVHGYESLYAGTSFLPIDQIGDFVYGSPDLNVIADRSTPNGLATIGWDDEGVASQQFDIIRDGILVGFQTNRRIAAAYGYNRSNGCSRAASHFFSPLLRIPNVSISPNNSGPCYAELISSIENGILVIGDKSWSIDTRRQNFQFTGQRFFRIIAGKIVGQVRDVAYLGNTLEFWRSLRLVGNSTTWRLCGTMNCGKGQPRQISYASHGTPVCLFQNVEVLNSKFDGVSHG